MRWDGFGRSLAFAAIAGAGWPAFAIATRPFAGARAALAFYLLGVAALYVAGIGRRRVRSVAAALVTAALGAAFAGVAQGPGGVALGAAIGLGIARSGILYRARVGRAFACEGILLGGGLLLARFLASPDALGVALALWGFLLVQSAFFLIGGMRDRTGERGAGDRFEQARRRALALLGDES